MKRPDPDPLVPFYRNERLLGPLTMVALIRIVLVFAMACTIAFTYVIWRVNDVAQSDQQLRFVVCELLKRHPDLVSVDPHIRSLTAAYDCTKEKS